MHFKLCTLNLHTHTHTHTSYQEVIGLVQQGRLKLDSQAGRSIGYRQVLEYLQSVWGFPPPESNCGGEPYSLQVQQSDC